MIIKFKILVSNLKYRLFLWLGTKCYTNWGMVFKTVYINKQKMRELKGVIFSNDKKYIEEINNDN